MKSKEGLNGTMDDAEGEGMEEWKCQSEGDTGGRKQLHAATYWRGGKTVPERIEEVHERRAVCVESTVEKQETWEQLRNRRPTSIDRKPSPEENRDH